MVYRPVPILLCASICGYASGGTANYLCFRAIITTTAIAADAPANDIHGSPMQTTQGSFSVVGVANCTGIRAYVVPAGTYHAVIQSLMQGGATTTVTEQQSDVLVYQVAG
jgi:hypothetical protein